jgi:hypothetical protein
MPLRNAPQSTTPQEEHMKTKTCPDCDGDGVVDKVTDDETQCQRAVALVLYLMMTTTLKKY